jgi:hypothetical protein
MNYYKKYLKYKKKYTLLKSISNKNNINLIGGSRRTIKGIFISRLQHNIKLYNLFIENLRRDIIFKLPSDMDVRFPDNIVTRENQERAATLLNDLFDMFYDKLLKLFDNNPGILSHYDNFIILSYLSNTFGEPSSLENIGRFKDSIRKYKLLDTNRQYFGTFELVILESLNGLIGLEDYLDLDIVQEKIDYIEDELETQRIVKILDAEKREIELKRRAILLEKKRQGHMTPLFETENVRIFKPETVEQAKYYGRNTKWCTSADKDNRFLFYKKNGDMYIFISKRTQKIKYQLFLNLDNSELKDTHNEDIKIPELLSNFNNDAVLLKWLTILIGELIYNNKSIVLSIDDGICNFSPISSILLSLPTIDQILKQLIDELNDVAAIHELNYGNMSTAVLTLLLSKKKFNSILSIIFDIDFNQALGTSLYHLPSLQNLRFGENFNQALGTSLHHLPSLQNLRFGWAFNQPLGNSLDKLKSLTHLTLGFHFNEPLRNSLDKLRSLTHLTFGSSFNQPLGNSLDKLKSLTHLTFGSYFNQPLGNSLDKLKSLTHLTLSFHFNEPLRNSLNKLTSLRELELPSTYHLPLELNKHVLIRRY